MILVLVLSILLSAAVAYLVIRPLASGANQDVFAFSHKGFADERELRAVLELRDAALRRLVHGATAHPALAPLNKETTFEVLVSVCLRLQRAQLPTLPEALSAEEPSFAVEGVETEGARSEAPHSAGMASKTVLTALMAGLVFVAAQRPAQAQPMRPAEAPSAAQDTGAPVSSDATEAQGNTQGGQGGHGASGAGTDSDAGSGMSIPPPHVHDGVSVPQVSQFVLSPRHGELHVYYLGVFSHTGGTSPAQVALPLPEGFANLKIVNQPNAVLQQPKSGMPVFDWPLKAGVNEIRAEFTLAAGTGTVSWGNAAIPSMAGTMLLLMPEYDSVLRGMTESALPSFNIWPPRIVGTPDNFKSTKNKEEYDPFDPNIELLRKMPPQFTRHLVRMSPTARPYPSFEVVGIVPSRLPLYVLATLVGALLFSVALYTVFNVGRRTKSAHEQVLAPTVKA